MIECIYSSECSKNKEIEKLKQTIEILKKENDFLKKDHLLMDYNVYNRHYLEESLKDEYYPKLKNKDWFYNFALIDINNLHHINRKYGYDEGDNYIRNVSRQILNDMNNRNVTGKIFRIGGDEFLIIYEPYDFIDFDNIDNITYSIGRFKDKKSFKREIKRMDKEIIKNKGERK